MLHNRYLLRGGEDSVFDTEVDLLRRHGCTVVTVEENNERVANLGNLHTAFRSIFSPESYRNIRNVLRQDQFDVVHVHNFFPLLSPSVFYAAQAEGVPVVQTLHNYRLMCPVGTFARKGRACEDCRNKLFPWPGVVHRCYRDSAAATAAVGAMISANRVFGTWHDKVDAYVVLTEFMRQKFIEGGFPAEKLFIKPNFVDPDPQPGNRTGGYALYAGRLAKEKGIVTLLNAWERSGLSFPLKIAGVGPLEQVVADAAERVDSIEYLGWQPSSELLRLMGDAALLVMPTEFYEGHPRVAIEAFARRVPVVSSRIGAMAEMIEDGVSGVLFNAGDAEDLVNKVSWAISNPDRLAEIGGNARREFELKYTADSNFSMLMEIYRAAALSLLHHRSDGKGCVPS